MRRKQAVRFRYGLDALFLLCSTLYLINRYLIKPHLHRNDFFFHGHFNDLLFVPAVLPLFLGTYRLLGLRTGDSFPSWREIVIHVVMWSFFFEILGPDWLHRGTSDPWDVLCYGAGGAIAWLIWNRFGFPSRNSTASPTREMESLTP